MEDADAVIVGECPGVEKAECFGWAVFQLVGVSDFGEMGMDGASDALEVLDMVG